MKHEYKFGLFAGSVAMGLADGPERPIALFADEAAATAIARRFYGACAYVERMADMSVGSHLSVIDKTNQQLIVDS